MRAGLGLLAAVALGVLAACPDPGSDCFGPGGSVAEPPPTIGFVGQPTTVVVSSSFVSSFCEEEQAVRPDSVSVEVYAPDNRLVPSTVRLGTGGASGTVSFTPDMPGRYHVLAAFAPVGGLRQVGVMVAEDRTAEAGPPAPLPHLCDVLERTARGTWVCDAAVVRNGVVAQRLPVDNPGRTVPLRVAVAGDVVWTADSTTLRRWVDTGEALVPAGVTTFGSTPPDFLLASGDELLMLHATFDRFVHSEGRLLRTGSVTWREQVSGSLSELEPAGILLRAEGAVALVHRAFDRQTGAVGLQACPYRLEVDRYLRTADPCELLPGGLAGVEDGVLWTVGSTFTTGPVTHTVRRYALVQGRLREQGVLEVGALMPVLGPLLRGSAVPLFTDGRGSGAAAVVAWRPARGDLVLEVLDRTLQTARASSGLYWGQTANTVPLVRARPSPP
jgi:hypothetical protein